MSVDTQEQWRKVRERVANAEAEATRLRSELEQAKDHIRWVTDYLQGFGFLWRFPAAVNGRNIIEEARTFAGSWPQKSNSREPSGG
jgi:hypothetical protein